MCCFYLFLAFSEHPIYEYFCQHQQRLLPRSLHAARHRLRCGKQEWNNMTLPAAEWSGWHWLTIQGIKDEEIPIPKTCGDGSKCNLADLLAQVSLSLYPYPYVVFKTQNAKQQHVSSEKRDFSRMFFVCFFIYFLCLSANIVFWCRKLQNRHCKTFPAHFLLLWVPSSTKYMWYFRTAQAPASLQSFYRIVWWCFIALIVENTSTSKLQRTRWGGKVGLKCVQDVQVRLQSLKIAHLVTAWSLGGCWTWSEVWSYEHDEHVFCLGQFMPVQVCLISLILPFCILLFPFQNLFSGFFSHACSSWSFGNLWYVDRTTVVRGHRTP